MTVVLHLWFLGRGQCLPRYAYVFHCMHMSTTLCLCLTLYAHGCLCLTPYVYVNHPMPLFNAQCSCLTPYANVHHLMPMSITFCLSQTPYVLYYNLAEQHVILQPWQNFHTDINPAEFISVETTDTRTLCCYLLHC